ncbi:MAG: acylneuraminate cytidylyltransferase family protein [Proteobacteria bacterium]|nr:acylneuraminate cytidylyltransferase family protein [Pseudomonadota bacterium]MBU1596406.1 acylneuraminate cytidylyltransferase family protein [Pseudomonadota bacterium]
MYKGKRILSTISARGGSKGVPGKNIRDLGGLPLMAWTIREARRSEYLDRLVVSSDDEGILAVARAHGAETPFVRPPELARDDTPGVDPVLHAVEALRPEAYDYVVLLQPTSPLRTVADIDGCIRSCLDGGWPCCISVSEAEKSPYYMFHLDEEGLMAPVIAQERYHTRRQELPRVFAPNGAVYVASTQWLARTRSYLTPETRGYAMPRERSWDVDELLDFEICELLLKKAGRI